MSADKRSVHTDALATLGTIIDETAERDAIHLAVEPCIAGHTLYPGAHVGLRNGVAFSTIDKAFPNAVDKLLGIVDPFLKAPVQPGERFWLLIYPRQITSLRHVWAHPDFPEKSKGLIVAPVEQAKVSPNLVAHSNSREWMESYAGSLGKSYKDLMDAADEHVADGSYLTLYANDDNTDDKFWHHYSIITGKVVSNDLGNFFRCTC